MARSDAKRLIRGDHLSGQITPEPMVLARRAFVLAGAALAAGSGLVQASTPKPASAYAPLAAKPSRHSILERPVPFEEASTYNNFYEFGLEKEDPRRAGPGPAEDCTMESCCRGLSRAASRIRY